MLVCEQVNEAAEVIYDLVDSEANLIFGAVVDAAMGQDVRYLLRLFVSPESMQLMPAQP